MLTWWVFIVSSVVVCCFIFSFLLSCKLLMPELSSTHLVLGTPWRPFRKKQNHSGCQNVRLFYLFHYDSDIMENTKQVATWAKNTFWLRLIYIIKHFSHTTPTCRPFTLPPLPKQPTSEENQRKIIRRCYRRLVNTILAFLLPWRLYIMTFISLNSSSFLDLSIVNLSVRRVSFMPSILGIDLLVNY